jgi:hypothetical protein
MLVGLSSLSWTIWSLLYTLELTKPSPTHLSCLIANTKWDWVIPSAFACVFASRGTWRLSCSGFLISLDGCCHLDGLELVGGVGKRRRLFLPTSRWFVRGSYAFPGGAPKATLVCHWATSLVGRFLRCPSVWTRFVQHLLAAEPPSVGRHNGDVVCQKAHEPREKNHVSLLWLTFWISPVDWCSSYCDWFIPSTRRYISLSHLHSRTLA